MKSSTLSAIRKLFVRRHAAAAALLLALAGTSFGASQAKVVTAQELVRQAVQNEMQAVNKKEAFFRYQLRRESTSGTLVREMMETPEGIVSRSLTWNGRQLTPAERKKDDERMDKLLTSASERERKFAEQHEDERRVLRILRALPQGLLFEFDGSETLNGRDSIRLKFRSNPEFSVTDRETYLLKATVGWIWIDREQTRVAKFDATLADELRIGWGLLGVVNRGGRFMIEQAKVSDGDWRMSRMLIDANGKALIFKSVNLKQKQEATAFRQVKKMSLQEAIATLKNN